MTINIPTNKPMAFFPDMPRDKKITDQDGNITEPWQRYFDQTTSALQTLFSPEGLATPQQTASNIALLGGVSQSIGNIIYDSTNNQFKGIILVTLGPPIVTATKTFTLT